MPLKYQQLKTRNFASIVPADLFKSSARKHDMSIRGRGDEELTIRHVTAPSANSALSIYVIDMVARLKLTRCATIIEAGVNAITRASINIYNWRELVIYGQIWNGECLVHAHASEIKHAMPKYRHLIVGAQFGGYIGISSSGNGHDNWLLESEIPSCTHSRLCSVSFHLHEAK